MGDKIFLGFLFALFAYYYYRNYFAINKGLHPQPHFSAEQDFLPDSYYYNSKYASYIAYDSEKSKFAIHYDDDVHFFSKEDVESACLDIDNQMIMHKKIVLILLLALGLSVSFYMSRIKTDNGFGILMILVAYTFVPYKMDFFPNKQYRILEIKLRKGIYKTYKVKIEDRNTALDWQKKLTA